MKIQFFITSIYFFFTSDIRKAHPNTGWAGGASWSFAEDFSGLSL